MCQSQQGAPTTKGVVHHKTCRYKKTIVLQLKGGYSITCECVLAGVGVVKILKA